MHVVESILQTVVYGLSLGSFNALAALGIALIFGVMRLINFAHGELIMAGGYVLVLLGSEASPWLWILAVMSCILLALGMERVAFRPVRGAHPSTLLVTSFAVSFVLQNVAIITMGALPRSVAFPQWLTGPLSIGGLYVERLEVMTLVGSIALLAGLTVFLHRTTLGLEMRAAAEDFRMARVLGVGTDRVIAAAFAISGGLAGFASLVLLAQGGSVYPTIGLVPVVYAFTATILGGMGSLIGAVLGGYVLGMLTAGLQVGLPPTLGGFRDALVFLAVIAIMLIRPQGLIVAPWVRERV